MVEDIEDFISKLARVYPEFYKIDVVDYLYDDDKYIINSEEYDSVLNCAHGDSKIVMVGEIGYYYPARVWIGEFGKIYAMKERKYNTKNGNDY